MNPPFIVSSCCCEEPPTCCGKKEACRRVPVAGPGPTPNTPQYVPRYPTVGRPSGVKNYPWDFWPAWYNGVFPSSTADVVIELTVVKRTIVQQTCSGVCPGVVATPLASVVCGTASPVTGTAGCQKEEFVDNFLWKLTANVPFVGVNPDQDPFVEEPIFVPLENDGEPIPGIMPGGWPAILTDAAAVPTYGDSDDLTAGGGTNPTWWPGETRCLVPRFGKIGLSVLRSEIPSSTYLITAPCGSFKHTNRCFTSTSSQPTDVCLDMPLVVLPGHGGVTCSLDVVTAGVHKYKLGGREAAVGLDIVDSSLIQALKNMGLTAGARKIGQLDGVWMHLFSFNGCERVRLLFGMDARLAANGVFSFPSDSVTVLNGTGFELGAGEFWSFDAKVSITPRGWCTHSKACGCKQSYSENCGSFINVEVDLAIGDCGAPNTNCNFGLGLEAVDPLVYTNPCHKVVPYLGGTPLERDNPGWVRYRNRWNFYQTASWLAYQPFSSFTGCQSPLDEGDPVGISEAYVTCAPFGGGFQDPPFVGCAPVTPTDGNQRIYCGVALASPSCVPCQPYGACNVLFIQLAGFPGYTVDSPPCTSGNSIVVGPIPTAVINWDPEGSCCILGGHNLWSVDGAVCDPTQWVRTNSVVTIT